MSDSHIVKAEPITIAQAQRMHPLVQSALAMGTPADPATLRELMQLQREWESGEAKKAFTEAMVMLKRDLPAVLERDKTVNFATAKGQTTYQHTTLAAAIDAIVPHLVEHGFSHAWIPAVAQGTVQVTCNLTHRAGHSEHTTIQAPPDTSGNKNAAQAVASTITLLQRYTLLSLLGIATRDMAEPTPADTVDHKRNLAMAGKLNARGIALAQAEAHVGRTCQQWTSSDLEKLGSMSVAPEPAKPRGDIASALSTIEKWAGDIAPLKKGLGEKQWEKEERVQIKAALDALEQRQLAARTVEQP